MVRNPVILGGSSHPQLAETICNDLGIPPARILLTKFSAGETRVEIQESVRGKDVFIIQSGGGKVNDHLMELLITISACKTASARRVTAVLPLFPYSRQSDIPYEKRGAPLAKAPYNASRPANYSFNSVPATPAPGRPESDTLPGGHDGLSRQLSRLQLDGRRNGTSETTAREEADKQACFVTRERGTSNASTNGVNGANANANAATLQPPKFEPQRGYKQWVAQPGTLVAQLLACAGADHVITMDLHDPQYQGFFDIPVDNLYGRHLLHKYILYNIPDYRQAVIVSPDAGGAKRATAIADALDMPFALIHKERPPIQITDRQNATMMHVGDVAERTVVLIDDLADTSNTITRAASLLKKQGATKVYALITHGVLSGDAIDRIEASSIDKLVVTNSVDQKSHLQLCSKLEVLEVGHVFAEAIRRVHHGESISVLFNYDQAAQ